MRRAGKSSGQSRAALRWEDAWQRATWKSRPRAAVARRNVSQGKPVPKEGRVVSNRSSTFPLRKSLARPELRSNVMLIETWDVIAEACKSLQSHPRKSHHAQRKK